MRPFPLTLLLVAAISILGCESEVSTTMQKARVFNWCEGGPDVKFGLPPSPWERSEHKERVTGVAFIHRDVPPGFITVGQTNELCRHDARPVLRELYERFDELDDPAFRQGVRDARRFEDTGFTYAADDMIKQVNAALTKAESARQRGDLAEAERHLESALVAAELFEYNVEDLAQAYILDPSEHEKPERFNVQPPVRSTVDELPSVSVNYTMKESRGLHHGREVYVAWDNQLFVFTYLGPEKYIATFDAMMASVEFPGDE